MVGLRCKSASSDISTIFMDNTRTRFAIICKNLDLVQRHYYFVLNVIYNLLTCRLFYPHFPQNTQLLVWLIGTRTLKWLQTDCACARDYTQTHTHTTHQRPITVLGIKTSKNKIYYGFFAFVDTLPEQRRKIKIGPIYIKTVLFRFLSFSIILITSHFTLYSHDPAVF